MPRGAVFVPFCYYEAAANMLTNPVLDPFGKIPEFKYCAVKVTAGGDVPERLSFGGGSILAEHVPVVATLNDAESQRRGLRARCVFRLRILNRAHDRQQTHPPHDVRMQGFARRHTVQQALAWLDAQLRTLDAEDVPLRAAAGRVLAAPSSATSTSPASTAPRWTAMPSSRTPPKARRRTTASR